MRLLIAGVGRSGTTFLYKYIGATLIQTGKTKCFYEPLLWNHSHTNLPIETRNMEYNTSFLNHSGISVHLSSPLRPINERSCSTLLEYFQALYKQGGKIENVLVKDIRLNGRLKILLENHKDLKVILLTRNFLSTLNSSSPLFSFFGDEFHRSDRERFKQEFLVDEEGVLTDQDTFLSYQYWAWMTKAGLDAYKNSPDRVMVIPYEVLIQNRAESLKGINQFCGLDMPIIYDDLYLQTPVGPATPFRCLPDSIIQDFRESDNQYLNLLSEILPKEVLLNLKGGYTDLVERVYVDQGFKELDRKKLSIYYRKRYFDYVFSKQQYYSTPSLIEKVNDSHVLKNHIRYLQRINSIKEQNVSKRYFASEIRMQIRIVIALNEKPISQVKSLIESMAGQTFDKFTAQLILYDADDQYRGALIASLREFDFLSIPNYRASCLAEAIQCGLSELEVPYVSFALSTNPWLSTKLERELAAMGEEDIVLTYSDSINYDGNARLFSCASNNSKSQTELLKGILDASIPIPQSYLVRWNLLDKPLNVPLGLDEDNTWILLSSILYRSLNYKSLHSGAIGSIVEFQRASPQRMNPAREIEKLFFAMSSLIDQYRVFSQQDAFTRRLREHLCANYFDESLNELSDIIFSMGKNKDLIEFLERYAQASVDDI